MRTIKGADNLTLKDPSYIHNCHNHFYLERMRMSDGPRGVPNTDTASVSDEDIYKAEGVQPNEMKDLHNFLARNHNKYKPKDEEEESIRENEEFNENERRHGEQLSRDREDKDYRGGKGCCFFLS